MGIDDIVPSQPPLPKSERQGSEQLPPDRDINQATQPQHDKRDGLTLWKDVIGIIQSVATVVALVLSAWWFLRQGTVAPHANLTQSIQALKLHEKWRLVTLGVRFANVGAVPISLSFGRVYIARVLPLEPTIAQKIDSGG